MRYWQLQHAKNRLSEVLRGAALEGPQVITTHGREAGVVLSFEEYKRLVRPRASMIEFFRTSPLVQTDLDLQRASEQGEVLDL